MVSYKPMRIPGRWRQGYTLDYHTISSTYIGDDEYGNPQFDTQRSEVGDLLFRLKYRADRSTIPAIVEAAAGLLDRWRPGVDALIAVPPTRQRAVQPVLLLAQALSQHTGLPYLSDAVTKTRDTQQLKDVHGYDERTSLLAGMHAVDTKMVRGVKVLLFDDLYRSGATMNAIADALYDNEAADVFALTVTRTRSNR